jgi:hypothetical protein
VLVEMGELDISHRCQSVMPTASDPQPEPLSGFDLAILARRVGKLGARRKRPGLTGGAQGSSSEGPAVQTQGQGHALAMISLASTLSTVTPFGGG